METHLQYPDHIFLGNHIGFFNITRNSGIRWNVNFCIEHPENFLKGRVLNNLERPVALADPESDQISKFTRTVGRAMCKCPNCLVVWSLLPFAGLDMLK